MSRDERIQMWQERIDAYSSSDAPSIKAWRLPLKARHSTYFLFITTSNPH